MYYAHAVNVGMANHGIMKSIMAKVASKYMILLLLSLSFRRHCSLSNEDLLDDATLLARIPPQNMRCDVTESLNRDLDQYMV